MFLVQNRGYSDYTQNIVCYEIDNSLPTQNRAQDKVSGASVVELESEDNSTGKFSMILLAVKIALAELPQVQPRELAMFDS